MADDDAPVDISRLKRRRDFLRVAAERRKWVTPGLILQAAPMPRGDLPSGRASVPRVAPEDSGCSASESTMASVTVPARPMARVGFTVSKKVGNAVQRNRARRRLRAAADALMGRFASGQTDYVIIGRVQTLDRPFEDLLKDLEKALKRVLTAPKSAPFTGKGGRRGGRQGQAKSAKPAAKSPADSPSAATTGPTAPPLQRTDQT